MTSKIVVNNIEADAGVSTVFFNSDIGATDGTLNVDGNLTVDGVITYEDVTSVDSVGIVTARSGIHITGGSVGIGTDNPSAPLHLSGPDASSAKIKIEDNNNGFAASEINVANGGRDLRIAAPQDIYFQDVDTGEKHLYIESGGNIGIGTDNPNYLTTIAAGSGNAKLNLKRLNVATDGNAFGSLFYTNSDGTDVASIRAHRESANDDAYLGFATRNTGGSITERA